MARKARKRGQRKGGFPSTAPAPIVNIADKRAKREPLQPNRRQTIFLAVLSVSGNVNYSIAMAFARCMASSMLPECPWTFIVHIEAAKKPADFARNEVVKKFLYESDADWLVMVDEDQIIPENFWQLCTVKDADIISAVTPVWVANMDPECSYRVNHYGVDDQGRCYNLPVPDKSVKNPYRVPVVGTGCVAVRRRVFAPKPVGLGENPFYFTYEETRKVQAGEDINFGVDANRAGFVVCVNPSVVFDHVKEIPLLQIERYYDARKAMEDAGRAPTDEQRLSIG